LYKNSFEDTSVLLIGKNGGLSNQILANSNKYFPGANFVNVSSREITESTWTELLTENGLATNKVKVIWCAGSAKPSSPRSNCSKDLGSLQNFCNQKILQKVANLEIFFMSSGGTVYGNNPGEVNENSELKPGSHYAEMKVRSENLLRSMTTEYGIPVRICRLANMYGCTPSSQGNGLIDRAISSSRVGTDVMIFRSLISRKQYGTFCDYAQYILKFVQNSKIDTNNTFYIKNIYSDWDYSIGEILELVRSRMSNLGYNLEVKSKIGSCDLVESVILHNSNSSERIDHKWQSLQEFLESIK